MIVGNDAFFETVISLVREGKTVTIPVKGDSMQPFIEGGVDSVVLEGVEEGSPAGMVRKPVNVGDIVLFRTDSQFIVHRILRIGGDGVAEIQGDGILQTVDRCPSERIFARVITILKKGRRPIPVQSTSYRIQVHLWLLLKPFRRPLLAIWKRVFRQAR